MKQFEFSSRTGYIGSSYEEQREEYEKYTVHLEYIKHFINNALNLSISLRAGKETNMDFFSSSE